MSRQNSDGVMISLENVSFRYRKDEEVLQNVTLQVNAGNFAAIIGPSGAGKSTLVSLILGLHLPTKGNVKINGENASSFISKNPGTVAYVPQSAYIISGSILENVALGYRNEEIDQKRVRKLLQEVGLLSVLEKLPDGLGTQIDQNNLSGGQLQRLSIARALYKEPRLLVLDEPTSAQDADSEQSVFELIHGLNNGLTLLVVAHRLSTIQAADKVFLIESGVLTNSGRFVELQETSDLVARQSSLLGMDNTYMGEK